LYRNDVSFKVISGHLGWVRCAAVEPANEWFVTGAADRVIKVCKNDLLFLKNIINKIKYLDLGFS
jgi:hypothetical protein